MSARLGARFEVVRSHGPQPWHARLRAGNGRIVWTTEQYVSQRRALRAVELICGAPVSASPFTEHPEVAWAGSPEWPTEVRTVDERLAGATS